MEGSERPARPVIVGGGTEIPDVREGGGGSDRLLSGGGPLDGSIKRGGGPFMGGGPNSPVRDGTPDGVDPPRGGLDCLDGRLFDCASNCKYQPTLINFFAIIRQL